ncbi:glycosyltransferase involved in cell wall biosynthesis [Balneicella halophila]|uniref:Glycosyltransferase involved in cell wall biosynthesis n=1 Tax=Balneicella halophila TaxID=1537566 RepID=A0A7L4UPW7_BALHA|nr:glycosyltransferase [Balneicella halophila]PVX51806.1 glycosyltransferase involved in cell wall biosynthesis [Balneicella halophila]
MKIAMLSTFYPYRGGIAQFNARLYNELSKSHDVRAYTFSRQYPSLLFPGKTQYVVDAKDAEKVNAVRILDSVNPFSYWKTGKTIKTWNPDVLFLRYWHPFFAPSLGTVAKMLKKDVKVITLVDNAVPHEDKAIYKPFTHYFTKQSDGFVAMSKIVENDLRRLAPKVPCLLKQHPLYNHFGEKKDKIKMLKKYSLATNKKTLLFFGFIREYKGLDILIEAFAKLNDNYQLIIAGESYTDFSKYQYLINKNPNKERIVLLNRYIADEEVASLFSCADVCVQPYRSATQSGITAVSYHFDVPMIVTNVGGLKEDVRHEKTGLIVEEINATAIVDAIVYYFNENKRETFQKGIRELKKELSWKAFCEELLEFISNLKK